MIGMNWINTKLALKQIETKINWDQDHLRFCQVGIKTNWYGNKVGYIQSHDLNKIEIKMK